MANNEGFFNVAKVLSSFIANKSSVLPIIMGARMGIKPYAELSESKSAMARSLANRGILF